MADVLNLPVIVLSFVAGALVIGLYYISNFVKSVAKESEPAIAAPELKKNTNKSSAAKPKKNVERRVREGKSSYSHPWLLTSLKGHTGAILDMDLSPNGKYLATTAEDRAVMLWRSKDWSDKEHRSVRVNVELDHGSIVRWSPDSKALLLVRAADNVVQAYRVVKKQDGVLTGATKGTTYPKVHTEDIIGLGIASTGKFIASCTGKTALVVTDIKGNILAQVDTVLMKTNCAGVSPCGRYVYAAGFTPDAKLWEVKFSKTGEFLQVTRAFELTGHSSGIHCVSINQDSSRAATVSKDGTWRVYDIKVEAGKWEEPRFVQTGKLPKGGTATALALSPAGNVVAVAIGSTLLLYFADTGELDATLPGVYETGNITRVLFDYEGKYVLTSGLKHVRVFHNVTGHKVSAAGAHQKLLQHNLSAATRQRLELQASTAEALIASLS